MDTKRKSSVRFTQNLDRSLPLEVSASKPIDIYNDPLFNKDGTRNLNIPFELFALRRQKAIRDKERKKRQARVSAITDKDNEVFEEALEKLQYQITETNASRMKYLSNLQRSRAQKIIKRPETRAAGDTAKYPCPMTYSTSRPRPIKVRKSFGDNGEIQSDVEEEFKTDFETTKTMKLSRKKSATRRKSKSQLSLKAKNQKNEIKRRTPKNKPVIRIPPLKMKAWKPPQKTISKITKIVKEDGEVEFVKPLPKEKKPRFPPINYPKVKTRKWEPPKSDINIPERRVVKIDYPPLKMRKIPWRPIQKTVKKIKKISVKKLIKHIPQAILPKRWHYFDVISPKMQVLPGSISQYSKKFSFVSNGKQSAFIATAALTTQDMTPTKTWTSKLLDEIIVYGDINFRRQLRRLKNYCSIKPSDLDRKFYLRHARVRISIGEITMKAFYDPENIKEILDNANQILSKYSGIIFLYNNQSYAIWKEENGFFIFNSEDTDDEGKLVGRYKGACCVVRSTCLQTIVEYLVSNFRISRQIFEIYSFSVEKIVKIEEEIAKITSLIETNKMKKIAKKQRKTLVEIPNLDNDTVMLENNGETSTENSKPGISSIIFHHQPESTFGDHFQTSSHRDHNFLICESYLSKNEKNRAPFISSVAVVMLRICKSSLWTSATIDKIFQIGHSLYTENVESMLMKRKMKQMQTLKIIENNSEEENEHNKISNDKQLTVAKIRERRRMKLKRNDQKDYLQKDEVFITEIQPVISIGKLKLMLSVESIIIGRILSRNSTELSLQKGVDNLFKHYDIALILGRDVVAIWREQNHYFMFDPNQCDQFRKANENSTTFNSCLSCFKSTNDLVKLYIENLEKDQRNSIFKICKVETSDFVEKSSDWYNFKGISKNKWIINAHISESSEEFSTDNRNNQSSCIALTALAKTRELGVMHWNSNVLDEIIRLGDEFHTACVIKLKEMGLFEKENLKLNETLRELKLEKNVVDFYIAENIVSGKMDSHLLYDGLKEFFANDDLGIMTYIDNCMAIFKYQDAYYLFDSKPRNELGKNFKTFDPLTSCVLYGTACIIRFTCLCNLAIHIISNSELTDSSTFTINKVEVCARNLSPPCYYNYTPCEAFMYGGMLRAKDNYHEDCEQFKCDAVERTLCNLISCMCYTKVLNPRNWEQNDVNEIIKIGIKMFCKIADQTDAIWNLLESIEICSIKMKIRKNNEISGEFVKKETILPEINEERLEEKNHFEEISPANQDDENPVLIENIEDISEKRSSVLPQENIKPTLKEILQGLDENVEFYVIICSQLFNVAVFKINKFYFIFDPKESNGDGKLVKRRLEVFIKHSLIKERDLLIERLYQYDETKRISQEQEFEELLFGRPVVFGKASIKPSQMLLTNNQTDEDENLVNVYDQGSAYVSWFTTLDLLCSHLINKIPEKFRNEQFTITSFDIISDNFDDNGDLSKWNDFEPVAQDHWIIRGTFSQNDSSQFILQRNDLDSANCMMALIFAELCNDNEWNSTILDIILNLGYRLYKKSASKFEENYKLKINDLDNPIFISPFIINTVDEVIKHDFIFKKDDKFPFESFKMACETFMNENRAGILISKDYHVSLWKNSSDDSIMMFDPHDIGPDGLKKSTGVACLQRFTKTSKMIEIFFNNIKDIEGLNEFYLMKIKVSMEKYNESQENKCQKLSITINQKVKTIRGKRAQVKTGENISKSICYAIASISLSRSLDSEYYTPDIIDKIIIFGNELLRECKINNRICFKDFDINRKISCCDEISWNIQLHDTFANIQLDIFQRGIISKNVCPLPNLLFSLEEFFTFHRVGVLITSEFIVALWKENCEYLVFYSCEIDESGNVSMHGHPGVVIFKSVHDLYSNVISNINNHDAKFELRICDIEMSEVSKENKNDACNEEKIIKQYLKEEIIMPAVEHREVNGVENYSDKIIRYDENDSDNEELKDMIRKLKKRSGKTFGFMEFSRGGFLCGRLSQKSKSFDRSSRKFHSQAICVASAAMNAIKSMNCWNGDIIDQVVIAGNNFYIESSIVCGNVEVETRELVNLMFMADREVETKIESCFEFVHEGLNVEQLIAIFNKLFSCYKTCYIKKYWDCWTVVKNDNFYYLFDPNGIEVPLKKVKINRPTLYRFNCLIELLEEFLRITKKDSRKGQIEIGGIIVVLKDTQKHSKLKPKTVKKTPICAEIKEKAPRTMMVPDIPKKCNDDQKMCPKSKDLHIISDFFECP